MTELNYTTDAAWQRNALAAIHVRPCKQCGEPVHTRITFGRPECADCAGLNQEDGNA